MVFPDSRAQTDITFAASTKFDIPAYNTTITFAVNGSYSDAKLQNNGWVFTNLRVNDSSPVNLKISCQKCNITVLSYFNNTAFPVAALTYRVDGQGVQTVNLGLGNTTTVSGQNLDWTVIHNGRDFLAEGETWNISQDGTVTVSGVTGNLSVAHFGFLDNLRNDNSNLPFYMQHSVTIATIAVTAATIGTAVLIKVRSRKNSDNGQVQA